MKTQQETQMPGPNERMKEIIRKYSDGNVANFVASLEDISHQTLNRIFNPDSRNGKYPGVSTDIIAAVAKAHPEIDINWLITGSGSMLKEFTLPEAKQENDLDSKTTNQILFILAETVKDQAAARREQMELMNLQGRILERIDENMAREDTQAKIVEKAKSIETSLAEARKVLATLERRQHLAIDEIRDQFLKVAAGKKTPLKGVRKKSSQSNGNG